MVTNSRIRSLSFMLAALALTAGTAAAQPKPALTQEIDGPGRDIYRQSASGDTCDLAASCTISIPVTVPAGRRLIITYASAEAWLNGDSPALLVGRITNVLGGSHNINFSVPGPGDRRGWSGPVTFYVEPGESLSGLLRLPAGVLFVGAPSVTLMGHFVTP